uniref:Ig-like domain-containing protein n=1 Tax=Chrysemys picta bellii TaxID=8478 RepID=A0A8C3H5Z3_CHRPI
IRLQNALLLGSTALFSACLRSVQSPLEVTVSEGHDVLLQCNFTTDFTSPNLFWYRQYPNQPPQHILTAYTSPAEKNTFTSGKFSTVLFDANKTVLLKIGALSLQDRAVYHCALRPTMGQSCISGWVEEPGSRGFHREIGSKHPSPHFLWVWALGSDPPPST